MLLLPVYPAAAVAAPGHLIRMNLKYLAVSVPAAWTWASILVEGSRAGGGVTPREGGGAEVYSGPSPFSIADAPLAPNHVTPP